MKPVSIFLAVSLLVNVAGAWWIFGPRSPDSAPTASSANGATAASTGAAPAGGVSTARPASAQERPPARLSLEDYRDQLRAAGLPPLVIQAAIRGLIQEPRQARQREFYAAAANQPWWQGGIVYQDITPEQTEELRKLREAEREEILRVLGPGAFIAETDRERYSFLPPEKAERLVTLDRELAEKRRVSSDTPTGLQLAEQQRQATADYEREVAALLTPEERASLAARDSNTARNLGNRFEFFAGTEEEYQRVFDLQKAFDEKFLGRGGRGGVAMGTDAVQARSQANQQLIADIQAAFTPERYAAYLQAQRPEYRALVELQRRFDVPQAAFAQAAHVHASVSAEGQRIADDSTLSREQKRAALVGLAERARTDVRSALGNELGNTYLAATSTTWIDLLERGSVYASSPTGGQSTRNVATDRPLPPPGAAAPKL